MASVRERVRAMDEFQVVRCFEAFSQQLIAGSRTPLDTIKKGVPASIRSLTEWQRIESLTPKQAEQALEPTQAAETARNILMNLADDPTFGPLLDRFLASYRDDELVADVVLAVGLAASMILMVASTTIKGKIGDWEVTKHNVDPAMIKALFEPFAKILAGLMKK